MFRVRYVEYDEELDEFSKKILDNPELGKEIYEKWDRSGDEFKSPEDINNLFENVLIER